MLRMMSIVFRVATRYSEESARSITELLRKEGFNVFDVQESDIVNTTDGTKVTKTYLLTCRGSKRKFNNFKKKYKFTEILSDGHRILV